MTKFLSVQHTYHGVEVALFFDDNMVETVFDDKKRASKNLIAIISSLLKNQNCSVDDLSFISANQGPGPFTTLRVVIAYVNGLAFGTKKPLIGVDGLDAILQEFSDGSYSITVALLDAFSKDVYFAIQHKDFREVKKGYRNIFVFLQELKNVVGDETIQFIGNGVHKYKYEILSVFKDKAFIAEQIPQQCSIKQVGLISFEKWKNVEGLTDQLLPMYLKQMAIKKLTPSSF